MRPLGLGQSSNAEMDLEDWKKLAEVREKRQDELILENARLSEDKKELLDALKEVIEHAYYYGMDHHSVIDKAENLIAKHTPRRKG
jgi:hypothetical protein